MTAFIRPSLILRMDLDERLFNDEQVADIKRSYSYVAPSLVQSHEPADEARVENVMRFMIKLHRPYWDKSDAEAQELWQGVMPKWLHNMFAKVSNTITAANNIHAENGEPAFPYHWLELEFGDNALVALKTGSDSSFPADGVAMVERVRDLMNEDTLGEGVACVRIPSRASYEAQLVAAEAAEAERIAAEQAAAEAEAAAQEAAAEQVAADAAEPVAADVATADAQVADDAGVAAAEAADAQAAEEQPEPAFSAPVLPAFDVDYSTWGIEYADGTIREFDAKTGAFA